MIDGMYVDKCTIYVKKTVIFVRFEVTLLETECIACEIVNKRSLNVKNRAF